MCFDLTDEQDEETVTAGGKVRTDHAGGRGQERLRVPGAEHSER